MDEFFGAINNFVLAIGAFLFDWLLVLGQTMALIVIALSANAVFSNHDLIRVDRTDGRVSSLSPDTKKLMRNLDPPHTIYIEAFISSSTKEVLPIVQ